MNRFGLGMGGQREFTPTSEITEVGIPLKHWRIAWIAGAAALVIAHRFAVIPITRLVVPETAQIGVQKALFVGEQVALALYMLRALMAVFLLQFHDQRWAAPYAQRQAGDPVPRPAAPRWIARAVGWRPSSCVTAQAQAETQELGRPTQVEHVIEASILIGTQRTKQFANVTLELEEWRQLALYFAGGSRSVSTRDLERGGFSKGAEGSARRVNVAITENDALFDYGKWRKPVVKDEFAAWVMRREFENL